MKLSIVQSKLNLLSLILLSLAIFTGCTSHFPTEQPLTQLQIRENQSREFDTPDTKLVMKAMMNVLQDEGFIIKNAVVDLGLLSAEKQYDVEDKKTALVLYALEGSNARWAKQEILEASANISEFGTKTRVRVNFQTKTSDNYGCPKDIKTLKDPQYYQNFFNKVNKSLFLQQQGI